MSSLVQQFSDAFERLVYADRERYASQPGLFDESKHPRDNGGQFSVADSQGSQGIPGQQMGLFGKDASGQQSLFNVMPAKKSLSRSGSKLSAESLKSITEGLNARHKQFLAKKETISPADRHLTFQDESLEGQRQLFSRLRAGLDRMIYGFDPSKHPREPAGEPEGGQFTATPTEEEQKLHAVHQQIAPLRKEPALPLQQWLSQHRHKLEQAREVNEAVSRVGFRQPEQVSAITSRQEAVRQLSKVNSEGELDDVIAGMLSGSKCRVRVGELNESVNYSSADAVETGRILAKMRLPDGSSLTDVLVSFSAPVAEDSSKSNITEVNIEEGQLSDDMERAMERVGMGDGDGHGQLFLSVSERKLELALQEFLADRNDLFEAIEKTRQRGRKDALKAAILERDHSSRDHLTKLLSNRTENYFRIRDAVDRYFKAENWGKSKVNRNEKELFSRLREGLDRMLYEFDPSLHPREPAGSSNGGQFTSRISGPTSSDLSSRGVTATKIAPGKARVHGLVDAIEDWWQQHVSKDIAAPTGEDLIKGGLKVTKGSQENTVRLQGLTDSLNKYWEHAKAGRVTRFVDGILVDAQGNPVTESGDLLTGDHLREQQDREQGKQKLPFDSQKENVSEESPRQELPKKKIHVSKSMSIDTARARLEAHGYKMGDPTTSLHRDGMFQTEYQVTDPNGKTMRASAKGLQKLIRDLDNWKIQPSEKAAKETAAVQPDPRQKLPGASEPLKKAAEDKHGHISGAAQVHVGQLKVDPKRFQYKVSGVGDDGVTDELKSVKQFNPTLGGQLLVWRDPKDGQNYVINGHHRYELASRSLSQGNWDGNMSVYFLDSKTPTEARAQGALANIAEGG